MSRVSNSEPQAIEPVPIPDAFADRFVRIEKVGQCYRLVFAVTQEPFGDGRRELAVVARVVVTPEVIQALVNLDRTAVDADDRHQDVVRLRAIN